jgi:hypothetical protein
MGKRLLGAAVLLCAVAAMSMAAAAQAAPHWYKKNVLVGSAPVTTKTGGALTLSALGTTIKCKLADTEEIWNPASGGPGEDLVTTFVLSGCKVKTSSAACAKGEVEVLANGLPWPSVLVSIFPGPVIRDEILKVRLLVRCNSGTVPDEFEGTLTPEVGVGTLIFGGPGGGTLFDSFSNPMTVAGSDKIAAPPGKITAKDP